MADERQPGDEAVIALGRATLSQVDFRRARFDRFDIGASTFIGCDFRGLRLDQRFQKLFATRPRSLFRTCRFDGADFRRVRAEGSRFERCTFDDARLDGWKPFLAEFVDCRFAGTMNKVTFAGRPPSPDRKLLDPPRERNEFKGNDFRDTELVDTVFIYGIDLAAQRWPDDERYLRVDRFPRRLSRAREQIARWDDSVERAAGRAMCDSLAQRWRDQDEIIALRVSPAAAASGRVQVRVWEALLHAV